MTRVGRRGFMGGVAAAVAVAAAPVGWVGRAFAGSTGTTLTPDEKVARLFSAHPDGTKRIGDVYLAAFPDDQDADALRAALAPVGEDPVEWWAQVNVGELRRTIRESAHADFEAEDIVDLEGWQLAKTEARAAALFTLTQ